MEVILIAAVTANGMIARHSLEPVNWSRDLKLFKNQTMGQPVIMGSNTYKTLVVELKGRDIIVVHRRDNPENILAALGAERCFVIGGTRIFSRFAPYLTKMYLTYHPLVFESGLKLFAGLESSLPLRFVKKIAVPDYKNIYQIQYAVEKQ